ncbi:TACC3 [Bugula neritina]|uniref:TACC3 n=1 Tax=Bugula neritina TaxID=10212 RepID=A0A7J7KJ28_BUGNE|nr:TACC3 [Bugula neritina]
MYSEREKKGLNESVARLTDERDTYAEGLHQVETSFTELHKRYDHMRQLMVAVRQREGSLTQHNQELQAKILEHSTKFQVGWCLRMSCVTLREIEAESHKLKRAHQNEVTKLQMANRKQELIISSQENQLSRKEGEVRELSAIRDVLLQKKKGGDN